MGEQLTAPALLRQALPGVPGHLEELAGNRPGPMAEWHVQRALRASLEDVTRVRVRQARAGRSEWLGLGPVDLLVLDGPRFLLGIELKEMRQSRQKLFEALRDAWKLAHLIAEGLLVEGALGLMAPRALWDSEDPLLELYRDASWSTTDAWKRFPRARMTYEAGVKGPATLPEQFTTEYIGSIAVDGHSSGGSELRLALVRSEGGFGFAVPPAKADAPESVGRPDSARRSAPDREREGTVPDLDRGDLLEAWLDARRFRRSDPDRAGYHARRLAALEAAFAVDLTSVPAEAPSPPAWVDFEPSGAPAIASWKHEHALRLFEATTDELLALSSPFARYREATPVVVALHQRHGADFTDALQALRAPYLAMLTDLLEVIWGLSEDDRVSAEGVRRNGFDPRERAPDPDDYL